MSDEVGLAAATQSGVLRPLVSSKNRVDPITLHSA